jgi:HEAT repeat protein
MVRTEANMSMTDARKQVTQSLARFSPIQIAGAARRTGIGIGVAMSSRRLYDLYPEPEALAAAVLKGDKAQDKRAAVQLKAKALVLLAELDARAALPLAKTLLADDEKVWCAAAADALALLSEGEALDALFEAAAGNLPTPQAMISARMALLHARHPDTGARAFAKLEELAADEDALRLRTDLLAVVGAQQYTAGRPLLERIARDAKDLLVREAAARALQRYEDPAVLAAAAEKLEDANVDLRIVAVDALFRLDPTRAYDRLAPYFASDNPTSETALLYLLGHQGRVSADVRWRRLLERTVDEGGKRLFWDAWYLLADLGDVRAEIMLNLLREGRIAISDLALYLFRLPASALPVIESEERKREGVDKKTLQNVVKYLRSSSASALE